MKSSVKNSIIDDYISIILIDNFCNNFSFLNNKKTIVNDLHDLCKHLKQTYNELINIINLNDISFEVLNEQLSQNNQMYFIQKNQNFLNLKVFCIENINRLNKIKLTLKDKLLKLKINPDSLSL